MADALFLYLPDITLPQAPLKLPVFQPPFRAGAVLDALAQAADAASLLTPLWQDYTEITIHGCVFDIRALLWSPGNGDAIRLTEKERDLIMALYRASNRQLSREDLLDQVWGYRPDLETHTLETHIYRLRQKIEANADQPAILLTIPNGYALAG